MIENARSVGTRITKIVALVKCSRAAVINKKKKVNSQIEKTRFQRQACSHYSYQKLARKEEFRKLLNPTEEQLYFKL
ncbi:hypothetical protein TNCV_3039401 [Trichonephila clavipes]|nr:hypothetical protein TNCV_3039401 [Trichonephila clavipes]